MIYDEPDQTHINVSGKLFLLLLLILLYQSLMHKASTNETRKAVVQAVSRIAVYESGNFMFITK